MTAEQTAQLERLTAQRLATRYELAAINGEKRILVAYCSRNNRSGLRAACSKCAQALVALTGTDMIYPNGKSADGCKMADWIIRFTGRTQREAIMQGELPYVG